MVDFDKDKFLKAFLEAKMLAYLVKSDKAYKQHEIDQLRDKMEEVMMLVDSILEELK